MTYKQAVDYIHSLLVFGIKPGLERLNVLLEKLENPQDNLKFIHIAGTNGKGSTSTMISNALISANYKTGLFTSPYVFDFCERIRINDKNIIYRLTRRKDTILIIKYNIKNKRAWFQTNSMPKRKAIDINRVVNL